MDNQALQVMWEKSENGGGVIVMWVLKMMISSPDNFFFSCG